MVKGAVAPLLINQASGDARFSNHPALHLYGIESYIAVPLNRLDGSYFGTLCALDPLPANLSEDNFTVFHLLAQLIAFELEADEHQQRREAEVRALEDFVSIAAHDLRQPLSALSAQVQLLARRARAGATADELTERAERAVTQVRTTVRLSDALLDLARIEAGGLTLDKVTFDLVALVAQLLAEARTTAPDHDFVLHAPPMLSLSADPDRVEQTLRNLLDNAVKYSPDPRGPIQLLLDPHPADAPEMIGVQVRDFGIGVPATDLPHLFERRHRAANTGKIKGSGLGLYIAQQIVALHGGRIWADLAPDSGLAVNLRLPRA